MKRIILPLCALLLLLLSACGETEVVEPSEAPSEIVSELPTPTPEPSPTPTPTPTNINPLTGEPSDDEELATRRPMAIMLNNLKAAMPQQGNSQADIIYEVLAEGGITRMVGIYQDPSDLGNVGSIRSARQYYWELSQGHDALFIHAGGSPEFYNTQKNQGLTTVDGVNGYWPGTFWRDRERVPGHYYGYEHSVLSSGEAITAMLDKNPELVPHTEGYVYEMSFADDGTPAEGESAVTVTVPFSNKTTTFRYDEESKLYLAEQYGEAYIDGNDNTQIAVTNLLVLQTDCSPVPNDDKGRISVDLSSGEGWFACGGKYVPITWKKGGPNDQLRYFAADGQPLTLGRGKSYVCIIPESREIAAE